jgi:hypothetical protein
MLKEVIGAGIATGYGLDNWGQSSSPGKVKNFLTSTSSRPAMGLTEPSIQCVLGGLFTQWLKWQEREADHSRPASAEGQENMHLYIHSHIHLHGVVLN